jgi:hypothetical protein
MIAGLIIAPRLTAPRIISNVYSGFTVHAQAFHPLGVAGGLIFLLDVVKDRARFWNFFCGLALTTFRNR